MPLRALVLVSITLLGACSSLREAGTESVPVETLEPPPGTPAIVGPPVPAAAPITVVPLPAPAAPAVPPPPPVTPATTLLASVDAAIAAGELERAAALCERALRITPRDGQLWYKLASIRFQQQRYADAAGFARRALSFAAADQALTAQGKALLARANAALSEP
jgi:hypothetical protein